MDAMAPSALFLMACASANAPLSLISLYPRSSDVRFSLTVLRLCAKAAHPSSPSSFPRKSSVVRFSLYLMASARYHAPSFVTLHQPILNVVSLLWNLTASASAWHPLGPTGLYPSSNTRMGLFSLSADASASAPAAKMLFPPMSNVSMPPLSFSAFAISIAPRSHSSFMYRFKCVKLSSVAMYSAMEAPLSNPNPLFPMSKFVSFVSRLLSAPHSAATPRSPMSLPLSCRPLIPAFFSRPFASALHPKPPT
mmetsp:Transcript_14019/g.60022  ORF Transcript_14019/g.60022 Transcript_14019/m.60022 type:complete len:251 (+) Transcript_14019:181-933(+)